jgi:small subunit ribosomal protein S1
MIINDQNEKKEVVDPIEEKAEVAEAEAIVPEETITDETPKVETAEAVKEEVAKEEVNEQDLEEQPEKSEDDQMMAMYNEHLNKFKKGQIVEGEIVRIDERAVIVDIGYKSESAVSIKEFSSVNMPEVGTRIKVFIDSDEDSSGRLRLSKKKADFFENLDRLEELREKNVTIKGILRRRVKGGMIVEIDTLEAFLPGSQISTKPIPNLDQFIGKEGEFKVLKIDKERRNIIVSRKIVLEEQKLDKIKKLKEVIKDDAELDGEVRNITEYGAFIDLGGIDGLLHITDMSWGHIKHPSDMLNIGDKVKVKVLDFNEENNKVSLGLKQLVPHPWENIETKYPEGTLVSGKVVNVTNYGVFVELESGVEGLVHISEMSWTKKIKHPKQILTVGDSIKAIVLATSKDDKRISLGIKQMEANPWLTIEERYPIGSVLDCPVKSITPFGVFMELEENIEGLVHISDISWTKRIYHPKEVFKKGDVVEIVVLSIDTTLHRIALGVKQLHVDPWDNLDEKLPINTEVKAKIVKIISKGVLVDVAVDDTTVEGFVPLSHLSVPGLKRAGSAFEVDEELPLKIIELDIENRRLILSVKAFFFGKDDSEMQSFIDAHEEKITAKQETHKAPQEEPKEEAAKQEVVVEEDAPEEPEEKVEPDEVAVEKQPEAEAEEVKTEVPEEEVVTGPETAEVAETEVAEEETK